MKIVSSEKFIEKLGCDIYPITIIKFMLNRKKIMTYFSIASNDSFQMRGASREIDSSNCKACQERKHRNMLCRQHTSIERVLNADSIGYDLNTEAYFYMNEIFKMIGNRLVIVYCPHTKLIEGDICDDKVRKVIPLTIEDPLLTQLPDYHNVVPFDSQVLMFQQLKCWFNKEFSILTIPKDIESSNWCLIANK